MSSSSHFVLDPGKHINLALIYLAALTPAEFDVEIIDENISELKYDKKADVVGITFNSFTYLRAYEIADNYRAIGVPVILGGFHASLFPEETQKHADAIVVGEAEHVWTILLSDFKKGELKNIYKSGNLSDLKNLPVPRYDFYELADYYNVVPYFITRGCPFKCSFCCIRSVYGSLYRQRPVDDVIDQLKLIKEKYEQKESIPPLSFYFVDDNIWGDTKYAKELFQKLIPLNITWLSQASVTLDSELLELAAESGCFLAFFGFESLDARNLEYLNKKQNKVELYEECIAKIHEANIAVASHFILGLPYDNKHSFENTLNFLEKNYVEVPLITFFTPTPGTEQFNRTDWNRSHESENFDISKQTIPIFKYKDMSSHEFRQALINLCRKIYSDESIDRRLTNCNNIMTSMTCYAMNTNFKDYVNSPEVDKWINSEF